jgi:DNA polymerase-3 subunit delta
MKLDFYQFDGRPLQGEPLPAYLVWGDEPHLVERAAKQLVAFLLQGRGADDPSLLRLEGAGLKAEQLIAELRSDSLFGGRRLVVVNDAGSISRTEAAKLDEYFLRPVASSTLLLVAPSCGERKGAGRLAQELSQGVERAGGMVIECARPRAREMNALARRELERAGLKATAEGVQALLQAVGEDLPALEAAVEKLFCFLGPQGMVDADQVAAVIHGSRQSTVFQFTDAVGERSATRALRVLSQLLEQGESPLMILSLLVRHLRQLLQVSGLAARGEQQTAIQKTLGLPPFVVAKCLEQARNYSRRQLWQTLIRLDLSDRALKTGVVPPALQLEKLVRELVCSDPEKR